MIFSFIESVKYVGHLIPLAFLRVFLGYYYLQQALFKFNSGFLDRPKLAAQVADILPGLNAPYWYKQILEKVVIQHWEECAYIILGIEFAIAISYLIGYVVRPTAIVAAVLLANLLIVSQPGNEDLFRTLFALHLAMAWVGAGRCLGLDYYFFKRRRGFWW